MNEMDLEGLTRPISAAEPCGPDLDLEGDLDYMNYVAKAESLIPTSFFSGPDHSPFDRTSIDFAVEFETLQPLLRRTHDVRLLAILGRFSALNRDLGGFDAAISAIRDLLRDYWDEVHPRGEDGVFAVRMAVLETLDDLPSVIFPLQYTPLVHHRRLGAISYRDQMIASGEAQAREGENTHDPAAIAHALMEVEFEGLLEALGRMDAVRTALADIRQICSERAGIGQAARFERLPQLVDKIRAFLNEFVIKRDPTAALEIEPEADGQDKGSETAAPAATIELRSLADVADALSAVATYFSRHEPSNPALLLVRQAEQLMGKSFVEVMHVLVPSHVEQAAIYIGRDQMLQLPIERLSSLVSSSEYESPPADARGEAPDALPRRLEAKTRAEAVRLLEHVGAYYRAVEPSSPLPYLTDRARDLAGRDFLSLLKHVLPDEAFVQSNPEN